MIYTVTFNPALDYTISMETVTLGQVNRTLAEQIYPGGKGLNVSLMLNRLGVPSLALGFVAGFTGQELVRILDSHGCTSDFIALPSGNTRINVKIKSSEETDINGQGPDIPETALRALFDKLDTLVSGDILVLAGSVPNTLPVDVYERILDRLSEREIRFVVDATGELLRKAVKYHPFLIKPNHHELGELFGQTLSNPKEIAEKAQKLQQQGACNVLVSMAGNGAVLVDETGHIHYSEAPKGLVKNSVGAGDSMVAGFLAGYLQSEGSFAEAFQTGICTGSASAFSDWLADREAVEKLLSDLCASDKKDER